LQLFKVLESDSRLIAQLVEYDLQVWLEKTGWNIHLHQEVGGY
jgi:hypothetical protein